MFGNILFEVHSEIDYSWEFICAFRESQGCTFKLWLLMNILLSLEILFFWEIGKWVSLLCQSRYLHGSPELGISS